MEESMQEQLQAMAALNPAAMGLAMLGGQAQGMDGQPQVASMMATAGAAEPKGALNHFCQRYCKRPVTKEDIVYTSAKYGKVFQVTVTLNCMEGQQFVGETAMNLKDAEKNAAMQALIHFEPLSDTLPAASNKNKKRKTLVGPGMGAADLMSGCLGMGVPGMGAGSDEAEQPALKAMHLAAGMSSTMPAGDSAAAALANAANPALTCKVVLNTICMKLLKRPMQKGEVMYETHQTPIGFQSTVRLPCLPGEWGELAWAGEVASQQKQAEQNAAKEALEAVNSNIEVIKSLLPMEVRKPSMGGKGGGWTDGKGKCCGGKGCKGKGWGCWGKGMGMDAGMGMDMGGKGMDMGGKGWAGCGEMEAMFSGAPRRNLPRNRVTEVAITGEIIEWKGKFGWLRPHAEIQHPMAKKRGGKVFMSSKDVTGTVELAEGTMVQFHVYEDPTGLGAEDVTTF